MQLDGLWAQSHDAGSYGNVSYLLWWPTTLEEEVKGSQKKDEGEKEKLNVINQVSSGMQR